MVIFEEARFKSCIECYLSNLHYCPYCFNCYDLLEQWIGQFAYLASFSNGNRRKFNATMPCVKL